MTRSTIPAELRRQVIEDARHRCGYCLTSELLTGISLCADHLIPLALGGITTRENLWMACRPCNEIKNDRIHFEAPATREQIPFFNPRTQSWREHFTWSTDGTTISGLTSIGKATVIGLQLNRPLLVYARKRWVAAGWHPPDDL